MIGENVKAALDKLSPEARAKAEAMFNEVSGLAEEMEQGYLRQSDYTKKTQELAARRQTLEQNWEKANTEYQQMLADTTATREELEQAKKEKDDAAAKLAEAQKKLESTTAFDPAKVSELMANEMKKYAGGQTAYFGSTLKVMREHARLFPNDDLDPEELIKDAMTAGKTPREFWEEKFKVQAKRDEIKAAEKQKELDAARDEGYKKRVSEEANPATRQPKASEIPFYTPADEKADPWDTNTQTKADTEFLEAIQRARA